MSWGTDGDSAWGFHSVGDWFGSVLLSFPLPWKVGPLNGKYYGTVVCDASGMPIMSFWQATGEPSSREKEHCEDWTPEAWAEYCSDGHWESEISLEKAEAVVLWANSGQQCRILDGKEEVLCLVLLEASWEDEAYPFVQCGGPFKRPIEPSDPDVRRALGFDRPK